MIRKRLDHWFRHEYSKVLAMFIAKYGTGQIDNVEDALHDALYKAMLLWGFKGIPDNPSAWIYRVAKNNLIDRFRKKSNTHEFSEIYEELADPGFEEIKDDTLKLFFACCHPKLKEHESIILCLKFAAGFGLKEISRSLLSTYEATKKSFQRAKKHFKEHNLSIAIPSNSELKSRMDSVLKVIFLMFTEGYRPTEGDRILKEDLCFEALRIALALNRHDSLRSSKLSALLALMCYKSARIEARMTGGNEFIRLRDQDRSLWSGELIEEGNHFLSLAIKKDNHSEYHFHAAVESQYVNADKFENTNWEGLLNIYNYWRRITQNPALELNRVVVVMYAKGAKVALKELNENCGHQKNHLFYAIKGEVLWNLKKYDEAYECFCSSRDTSQNLAEKLLMSKKIAEIQNVRLDSERNKGKPTKI